MNLSRLPLVILTIVGTVHAFAPTSHGAASYQGTVVDAETNAPLEGAVVVVIWYKKPLITMDGPLYFHNAKEVLTDANGTFSVDAAPGINWNPFTRVMKDPNISRIDPDNPGIYPVIVIFKPGYGPFPDAHVKPPSESETKRVMLKGGAVVALPKLKTREELVRFADMCCGVYDEVVPTERIHNLLRLINDQRESLGLKPIGPVERQKP
jgi:hypothetical protein